PFSKATISPAWQLSRPCTRAMPSPTDSTWPTSETSASAPKFLIWAFRMSEISAARMSMGSCPLHKVRQIVQLGADRGVDQARPDPELQTADQRGIDLDVNRHGPAQRFGDSGFQIQRLFARYGPCDAGGHPA